MGMPSDHPKQAELLRIALGGLKGPLMKIAQILATIPDAVPKEYAQELAQLQADAPPMGWGFVKRRMAAELGSEWEKKFKHFDHDSCAAASLGQVHRAVGLEGRLLACKLQYPDMESTVEADLKQLKLLFALFERYDRAVSTAEIQKEIADRLREELDYRREAKHMRLYSLIHAGSGDVHVPESLPALSTDRLLTMDFLSGDRMAEVAETADLAMRNRVAMNMFHAWYKPFYGYGVIHGDPHLGNYSVCADGGINLLDYGCVRIFDPVLVGSVITLYTSLRDGRVDQVAEAYQAWGFTNPSKKLVEILNIWARFVYAPLLEDRTRPIDETNTGLYGRDTANKVHRELRAIGGVTIPRAFVFMDRAAIGLGSVFLRLNASVNWHRLFEAMIHDFKLPTIEKEQAKALKACGLQKSEGG